MGPDRLGSDLSYLGSEGESGKTVKLWVLYSKEILSQLGNWDTHTGVFSLGSKPVSFDVCVQFKAYLGPIKHTPSLAILPLSVSLTSFVQVMAFASLPLSRPSIHGDSYADFIFGLALTFVNIQYIAV